MSSDKQYPSTMYWMGRPVEELTREEAIEALQIVGGQLHFYQTAAASAVKAGLLDMGLRRGSSARE